MRFVRFDARFRVYAVCVGAAIVVLSTQGAFRGVFARDPVVSYFPFALFAGLLSLAIGLFGRLPEMKSYNGTEAVTGEMLAHIFGVALCFAPLVVAGVMFGAWIENQGYEQTSGDEGTSWRFEPHVFELRVQEVTPAEPPSPERTAQQESAAPKAMPTPRNRELTAIYDADVEGPPTLAKVKALIEAKNSVGVTFVNVSKTDMINYCNERRREEGSLIVACPQ